MAKHRYNITSDEGLDLFRRFYPEQGIETEVGAEVELDLTADQRTALVAAGWLSEPLDMQSDDEPKKKGG